jgi:hypothetical protein
MNSMIIGIYIILFTFIIYIYYLHSYKYIYSSAFELLRTQAHRGDYLLTKQVYIYISLYTIYIRTKILLFNIYYI